MAAPAPSEQGRTSGRFLRGGDEAEAFDVIEIDIRCGCGVCGPADLRHCARSGYGVGADESDSIGRQRDEHDSCWHHADAIPHHAIGNDRALSVRLGAVLFILASEHVHIARLSVHAADLSDEFAARNVTRSCRRFHHGLCADISSGRAGWRRNSRRLSLGCSFTVDSPGRDRGLNERGYTLSYPCIRH